MSASGERRSSLRASAACGRGGRESWGARALPSAGALLALVLAGCAPRFERWAYRPEGPPPPEGLQRLEERNPATDALERAWTIRYRDDGRAVREGLEQLWWPEGTLRAERRWNGGEPDGLWRSWHRVALRQPVEETDATPLACADIIGDGASGLELQALCEPVTRAFTRLGNTLGNRLRGIAQVPVGTLDAAIDAAGDPTKATIARVDAGAALADSGRAAIGIFGAGMTQPSKGVDANKNRIARTALNLAARPAFRALRVAPA